MASRIFTYPDCDHDRTRKIVLINNVPDLTEKQINTILFQLSDMDYDLYFVGRHCKDVQWHEGIRGMAKVVKSWPKNEENIVKWLKGIDNELQ